jgi:phytoene synthase
MNVSHDILDASYAFCRRLSRQSGSSFYLSFHLLPHEKRRAMDALYAFMRHTDDLVDELPSTIHISAERRSDGARHFETPEQTMADWRETVVESLLGNLAELPNARRGAPMLPALVDTVERYQIPHEYLTAVIDGVAMDLHPQHFETFDDLRPYCERVASAVGLACIHVWGFHGPEALLYARNAGIAMQMTNILRDVKEDAEAGRVYLPQADFRACGYSVNDLTTGVENDAFHQLMEMEIERTEALYREGARLMPFLESDGRRIFGLMMTTYHAILQKIAHRPEAVLQGRVRLGKLKPLAWALRWGLLPSKKIDLETCSCSHPQ